MAQVFRQMTKTDYQVISETIRKEYSSHPWLDIVAIRSMLMDECNDLGIKWWGKENKEVIPALVRLVIKK